MLGETTITVSGVDANAWKEFQKALIDKYGTVYGILGSEITRAVRDRTERMKTESASAENEPLERPYIKKAIREAMVALGEVATIPEVQSYLVQKYGTFDHDISTAMGDLAINGAPSSRYKNDDKFLERISRGKYRLIR